MRVVWGGKFVVVTYILQKIHGFYFLDQLILKWDFIFLFIRIHRINICGLILNVNLLIRSINLS